MLEQRRPRIYVHQLGKRSGEQMKINCMTCGSFTFDVELSEADFSRAPVITLTCPSCGKSTALQEREGGGIEVSLDKHLESKRSQA